MDILHTKVQQCQQHNDSLLLIPCNVERDRKIIDIVKSEDLLELQGDQRKRVGIVALACVKHTRDSIDIAKVQLVVLVLCAACSQDDNILRQLLCKLCIVLSGLHTAIAACHDDKLTDRAGLDRIDDLVRQRKHLLMCETADNASGLDFLRRLAGLCLLNDR